MQTFTRHLYLWLVVFRWSVNIEKDLYYSTNMVFRSKFIMIVLETVA